MPSLTKSRSAANSKSAPKKKLTNGAAKSGSVSAAKTVVETVRAKAGKRVYFFGDGKAEGTMAMKNLLGGKGANLAEMANIGLPVPPGFTITTDVCTEFYKGGKKLPKGLVVV